uniref:Pentatricopeptide repeat-containing protein n=1 Tax=Chenopodium quinoa TaxID=63459 RepID=A0A803KMK9_CHEQI
MISSTQTPPSQVIHKPLISSHFTVIENPGKFSHQNHSIFSYSSSISEIETENHDTTSSDEVELENGGVFDDTHDVSSSQELELNPNFDEINENNDAQMSDIGLNDQELEGVNGSLESSLDSMDLKLNEEFVVRVLETPLIPGDHLIRFRVEMNLKEMGEKEGGVINAEMLNQLISAFSKLGKGKAAYEAFGKFEEFGYVLNVDKSEKAGEIISFLCKGYKSKEAHVVYLAAKRDNKYYPPQKAVNFLISCLSKVDETVNLSQEVLVDFSDEARKHAINPFSWVIRGLCWTNDIEGAKKLFAEMMEKGPPPGNAIFNIILTLFHGRCQEWLRKGWYDGRSSQARKVLSIAKRKHSKLCPATFHSLIRGYYNLGEFDRAMKLLSEMKDSGVETNVDEYNKLIQSLCLRALDWKSAEKLLEEMKEKGLYLPGIMRGLVSAVKELEQEAVGSEDDHAKP